MGGTLLPEALPWAPFPWKVWEDKLPVYLFIYHDENVNENENIFLYKGCHGILLTTLKVFFFPENQSSLRTKTKIFYLELSQTKPKVALATQWRLPAHMGGYKSYSFVSGHTLVSVLWPFPDASLRFLNGKLQGLQEETVQPGSWAPLWTWGAHTTIPMGTAVAWGRLFLFQTLRYFTLKCQNMLNVAVSSQKSTSFYCFSGDVFGEFLFLTKCNILLWGE